MIRPVAAVTCIPAFAARLAAALAVALLAGCLGGGRPGGDASPQARAMAEAVGTGTEVAAADLPGEPAAWAELDPEAAVLVTGDGWRAPELRLTDVQRHGLRTFVEQGGRLVLLGYAAALVHALELEPRAPRAEPYRWGFDARTRLGRAQLGFRVVSGHVPALFEGLQAAPGREHVYFLAGGEPCCVPLCTWPPGAPAKGEVLGRLARERDGRAEDLDEAVLARWQLGKGEVLACGLAPDLVSADPVRRGNGASLLRQLSLWLGRGTAPSRLHQLRLPAAAAPEPAVLPPLAQREIPGAPLLAHWGWQANVIQLTPGAPRSAEAIRDEVLLPSWLAGADLLELQAGDATAGLPIAWPRHDPLQAPAGYRSASLVGWDAAAFGALAQEAHARGMLVTATLDPYPVAGDAAERLVTLRYLARELGDVRVLGDRSIDGFSLRQWFRDDAGLAAAMAQDFQPAARLVLRGETAAPAAGVVRAACGDDGVPRGLNAAGLGGAFRAGFPGDLFPVAYVDCRGERPRPSAFGEHHGGGSTGDWIAVQVADLVRERIGQGGALVFDAHAGAVLGRDTVDYVHGIALEPLRAAVAARALAIGEDGWRQAQRSLGGDVQAGFGAEVPAPAGTCFLQNNHVRLFGSTGALLLDRQGLAGFRRGEAMLLAAEFCRTRLFGARPDADEVRVEQIDFLDAGARPAGGHAEAVFVRRAGGASRDLRPPAMLAFDGAPTWPQRAEFEIDVGLGYFELRLQLRAVDGQGIVAIGLDGESLQLLPFQAGQPSPCRTIPVHLARGGLRRLSIAVRDGGTVAIDGMRLVRTGDAAAETTVRVPAGSYASLGERSASSYHEELVELATLADLPGFLWRATCGRAARNLQMERVFALQHHRRLSAASAGDSEARLRGPFVLGSDDAAIPPLAIAPLQLGRYDHFALRGGQLVLVCHPEANQTTRLGFLLLEPGNAPPLGQLPAVFESLDRPLSLELGVGGTASLPSDLPFAWTRVVEVRGASRSPFLVRENGWWTWRGAQVRPEGGALLRLCHRPDDTIEVVTGQALLARTRPGPGSAGVVALREPEPLAATVRVLQPSRLAPPSVTFAADFTSVSVDGRPWAFHAGRTVFLPDVPGTYRVVARKHAGEPGPHVVSTAAPLRRCSYDPLAKQLVLLVAADAGRPADLPYAAILGGPRPVAVEGGEIVADQELRRRDPEAQARAAAAGSLIRFRAGLVRVRYE